MKPFLTFRAPDESHLLYTPKGRKKFKVRMWVKLPNRTETEENEIIVHDPIFLGDLKPILDDHANELIDILNAETFRIWAEFMHSINDSTTNEEIDNFCLNFPTSGYGFECYIWR
ncbi:hypothetical protein [Cellvibrio mixtus]|uniref:hypothetical protein n=1 Tax=Cellvibrio mixtus TaxID=39650 RepID=UPI000586CD0E|nr:hypothetical protein [Cellvibrio mixtus]